MKTEIVLKKIYRERNDASDMLYGDAPNERPQNVPADAVSWFEATLWEGNSPLMMVTGWTERDAITELFVRQNQATIDAMLNGARLSE